MSHETNPGGLGYIGDYTNQFYRDYDKPLIFRFFFFVSFLSSAMVFCSSCMILLLPLVIVGATCHSCFNPSAFATFTVERTETAFPFLGGAASHFFFTIDGKKDG